jgi:hypothetical protein
MAGTLAVRHTSGRENGSYGRSRHSYSIFIVRPICWPALGGYSRRSLASPYR